MEMDKERKAIQSESADAIAKSRNSLINNFLGQIGVALNQEITPQRRAIYCKALNDLSEAQLKHSFNEALRILGDKLPSILTIRTFAEQWRPAAETETQKILQRTGKPADWVETTGKKLGITQEEIQQWLKDGKEKQLERIRKVQADPAWQAAAKKFGVKLQDLKPR